MKPTDLNRCLPRRNVSPSTGVKIGVVTDVHYGDYEVMGHMRKFVEDMNTRFFPDFVVELGDLVGHSAGEKELAEINAEYAKCHAPRYYVIGNHDLSRLSRWAFKKVVGIDYNWTFTTVGFLHVIFLDCAWGQWNDRSSGPFGHIPREELEWLEGHLRTLPEDQPIIAFSHFPIRVFADREWAQCMMDNEDELMGLFNGYNLLATFSGHISPGGYKEVDGVHHFCLRKMWEFGSYSKITITPDRLEIEGENGQMSFSLPLA